MESIYYHEESINSSEEVIDHEENKDLGVGRSYECVFCKRGFNTAQALGGHMNIHRKDRARKPNNSSIQDVYTGPRLYHQIIPSSTANIQSPNHRQDHQSILSYATYFPPSSTSSSRPLYGDYHHRDDSDRDHQQPSDIHGDWRMRLSLEFPPSKNDQEKDLDLELRLGYHS